MDNKTFKEITAAVDSINTILEPIRKLHRIFEPFNQLTAFVQWQKDLLPIVPSVPAIPASIKTPLALYFSELQAIATRIASIQATTDNINQLCREFEDAKAEAESNYYHRLYAEEKEREIEAKTRDLAEANCREAELAARVYDLEIALRVITNLKQSDTKPHKKAVLSLKPCMTPSQIVQLYEATKWLFTSTFDQWRNFFSEDIQVFDDPIVVTSKFKSDVRILFYYLQKKSLIDALNYPSILEKTGAFSYEGKIITARQLHKPTEYDNYPEIGNYINIKQIASDL